MAQNETIKVNDQLIKQSWVDLIKKESQERGVAVTDQGVLTALIRNELLAQEAMRQGIHQRPDFAVREEIRRQELLGNLLIADLHRKNPVTEDMVRAEYEQMKKALGDKEYDLRHILVKTEAEARDVIAQLGKGGDFAKLARDKSLDAKSKEKGGQTGWVLASALMPQLRETVTKLQKGKYTTTPLQSNLGWHVIKLEGVRNFTAPTLAAVKPRLVQRIREMQTSKLVNDLRVKARIEAVK